MKHFQDPVFLCRLYSHWASVCVCGREVLKTIIKMSNIVPYPELCGLVPTSFAAPVREEQEGFLPQNTREGVEARESAWCMCVYIRGQQVTLTASAHQL